MCIRILINIYGSSATIFFLKCLLWLFVFLNDGFKSLIELLKTGCDGYKQQVWAASISSSPAVSSPAAWHTYVCSRLILKMSVPLPMVCIFPFSWSHPRKKRQGGALSSPKIMGLKFLNCRDSNQPLPVPKCNSF